MKSPKSYTILLETRAKREFAELPRVMQQRIADMLDDLQKNPRPSGCKRLVGREGYRLRSGDYRVLYVIDDRQATVHIYRIAHRREVYR